MSAMSEEYVTDEKLTQLLEAAAKAGGREWFTDPTPTMAGLAVVDDGASMWTIKCEWPQALFVAGANPAAITSIVTELQQRRAQGADTIADGVRKAIAVVETYIGGEQEADGRAASEIADDLRGLVQDLAASPASAVRVIGYVTEEALKLMLTVKPKSGWHYHMFAKDQADAKATIAIYASDAEALSALAEHL